MVRSFMPKFSSKSERRLLALCKNNPDEDPDIKKWNKNAVQYLVKKLKKNLDIINELEKAISQECSNTKCVPLPKTPDNRLLVSHRRGLPQVIYCRLWRWPDLQSHHQIKGLQTCESSVESTSGVDPRSQTVCVNPYHYERKKPASLEPVLVPYSRIPPDLSTSFEDSDPTGGTKAVANLIRFPSTITGATVRSLLSCDSLLVTPANPVESVLVAPEPNQTTSLVLPEETSTTITMDEQQGNNDQNLPRRVSGDEEIYMSYERDPQYHPLQGQSDQESYNFQEIMPVESAQQQYEQRPIYEESQPQPQLFLPEQQQPAQSQLVHQQRHIQHQHVHPQQQQLPIQQQQPQQQLPVQHQQSTHIQQPHQQQHMQQQHLPPPSQHQNLQQPLIQQQHIQQPHQHQQYQQPHQQYQQSQHQHPHPAQQGPMLRQPMNTITEVARPYQFKQNKFAHMARAMHEHNVANQRTGYDSQVYGGHPYTYSQHPHQQAPVEYPQQYQQQPHQGASTSSYTQQSQYPSHPPPSYAAIYPQDPQQHQYQQQEQMHLDYQQEVPMVVAPQTTYYEPVAGPSHSVDQPIPIIDFQEVPYAEGTCWCSISYHEYDQRVGEKYQPSSFTVSVDGYTHPACSDRFCLGGLSNVNRNEFSEWVRRRIGKGVKLTYVDSEVYLECLCESSVFVSSPMLGTEEGKDNQERISKVANGSSIRVFSNPQFSKLLSNAVTKGFEAVYKLTNYCTFRVSFVKGWGRNYKRQTILNTPCWIEVQLNGPLLWIDKVLRQMRPPQGCGSTS